MNKKRILMVNEASNISSGYGVYGKELLTRLTNSGKYEVAELACYTADKDGYANTVPWKVYCNLPNNEHEGRTYDSNPYNAFGVWKFDSVCLDFRPDIVIDIRDYWMMQHESSSPARPYYKWVIMPTVDASPQKQEWIDVYSQADAVFTYQDWSGKVLAENSGNKVKWMGEAPPAASSEFYPLPIAERLQLKEALGFGSQLKIIGTVMRNQRRKLYPRLFQAFRQFLDQTKRRDVILYCHTSYPDNGWDIPFLLNKYGISNKVYFTYICHHCKSVYGTTFQDAITHCKSCGAKAAGCVNVRNAASDKVMNKIINIFDLYVQYSNSEGFGMPQVEAAACGVPIASTNYSAMEDVLKKLDGYPIAVKDFYFELETGCNRALPDNNSFVDIVNKFVSMPDTMREVKRKKTYDLFKAHYSSWDKTADKWMNVIDNIEIDSNIWNRPPRFHNPAKPNESVNSMSNNEYGRWLIEKVLGEPSYINSHMESRLIRDLNYGVSLDGMSGLYYNEMAHIFHKHSFKEFNREQAYNKMVYLCQQRNQFEQSRVL